MAAVVAGHPHHARALRWLGASDGLDRRAACHALAETWATLTFDARDLERLWEQGDPRIVVPPDPPALPSGW